MANAQGAGGGAGERGFDLISGGTDNHLILIDLTSKGIGGKPAAQALDRAGHRAQLQHRAVRPAQAVRPVGHPPRHAGVTTRGLTEEHMPQVAAWMDERSSAATKDDEASIDRIAGEVSDLLAGFPMPGYRAA